MIERFVTSLHRLAETSADRLSDGSTRGLRGDAADAVRLQIDCMQQTLTPAQRASLHRLEELLDGEGTGHAILAAVREVERQFANRLTG